MDFNSYESLISIAQKTLKEVDPFLEALSFSQEAHEKAVNEGKLVRETVALYFERTNNERKGETVLEFLKKLIRNLSSALSELEKTSLLLIESKDVLSAKWSVYMNLKSTLQKNPNASSKRIHFEMYNQIPNWEDFLEESTVHILISLENGLVKPSALMDNVNTILNTIYPKYEKKPHSKFTQITSDHKECESLSKKVSDTLSNVTEKAQILSVILENSFI